jgi:hypothetical protein
MAARDSDGDFSLILGGPLYQMFRRAHLSGDVLELLSRRLVVLTGVAWLPLLALSVLEGIAWDHNLKLPFFFDVEAHVRFLVALPLLIIAELVVHKRMRSVVEQFLERRLIPDESRPRFDAAVASALRLRNSVFAEIVLITLVYLAGAFVVWREHVSIDISSWYGSLDDGVLRPSMAGWWFGFVSLPLFQFLLLRWYYRILIWGRFLWQVSRLELNLIPIHPDRMAGLGFLTRITHAFGPLLVAQGAVLSGMIADRIFFAGARLPQFKYELVGIVVFMVFVVLGPLLVFAPRLAQIRRVGLREYGTLAQRYVREFDEKWIRGGASREEPLIGSADIQSLADLENSFEILQGMNRVPFTLRTVIQLGIATLAPVAPLLLTMISMDELVQRALKILF